VAHFAWSLSPTAPAAPSLRQLIPSGSLIRCQLIHVYHHPSFLLVWTKLARVASAPTTPALTLCAVSSFILEGADPFTMSWHSCFAARWKTQLLTSWPPVPKSFWLSCWMPSCFLDVDALLNLGPLFQCCVPGTSIVFSQPSILYGFLLQHCPTLVPDDCVLCMVQEWNDWSSLCRQLANFFQDPPSPWVHFFSCWLHPTVRCQSPYRFFCALTVFTEASSLGTSSHTATGSITTEVGSLLSRQAVVSFGQAFTLDPTLY
jgi:hypothetical protein